MPAPRLRIAALLPLLWLAACAPDAGTKCTLVSGYADADGDGYGDPAAPYEGCDATGLAGDPSDCDDADATVHPGADETCDGRDEDCDGTADEDAVDAAISYADADGDGYGDHASGIAACDVPSDRTTVASDCDDTDATVNPAAAEACDERDDDCDGSVDEDAVDAPTWYRDADADGYGGAAVIACTAPDGSVATGGDCDDADPAISPAATEDCATDADDDCDGATSDPEALTACYADGDGDGWGDGSHVSYACACPAGELPTAGDCDDRDAAIHPDAAELCDRRDDDCDGLIDGSAALDASTWYADADGDGYGDDTVTTMACEAPPDFAAVGGDCDDADPDAFPGADERCDGLDQDCDGTVDEDATDAVATYTDADGDGYGDDTTAVATCTPASGTVTAGGDCDDADASVHPAAPDTIGDGLDADCDGFDDLLTLGEADAELDGVTAGDLAGVSVAAAGDVDADGYDDLWVGASGADVGSISPGAAWLVRGPVSGTRSLATADAEIDGVEDGSAAGYAIAGGGDGDGDGVPDVVIAAPSADGGAVTSGQVFVHFGGSLGVTSVAAADATFSGIASRDAAGRAVAWLGDMDGDGTDDLLVGAPYTDDAGTDAGSLYLETGPFSGDTSLSGATAELRGDGSGDYFGLQVAPLGDLDGDGTPDFVVGAMNTDTPANEAGTAYVFAGPLSGMTSASAGSVASIRGDATWDHVGYSVDGPGDVDGDGHDDVLVGSGGPNASYLFTSGVSGVVSASTADTIFVGNGTTNEAWAPARGIGDFDGDGVLDIALADANSDDAGTDAGAAYVFLAVTTGTRSLDDADLVLAGADPGDELGRALARVGDTDADGYDDLLVGGAYVDTAGSDAGGAWLLRGR